MKYKFGSNYFPAEIVMSMWEEDRNWEIIGIIDNDVDDLDNKIQEYNEKFKIIRPLHIYSCQKIDFSGAIIYAAPYF